MRFSPDESQPFVPASQNGEPSVFSVPALPDDLGAASGADLKKFCESFFIAFNSFKQVMRLHEEVECEISERILDYLSDVLSTVPGMTKEIVDCASVITGRILRSENGEAFESDVYIVLPLESFNDCSVAPSTIFDTLKQVEGVKGVFFSGHLDSEVVSEVRISLDLAGVDEALRQVDAEDLDVMSAARVSDVRSSTGEVLEKLKGAE